MQTIIILVLIGLVGGVAVGLQGPLTSLMSQHVGVMESVFIIHVGGTIAAGAILLLMGNNNLANWRGVPWYALGAGVLGLVILSAVSYTIPRLGVTPTVTLIIAAQLTLGAILDHYGLLGAHLRPMDWTRLVGIAVLFLGTWLMVR